MPRFSELDPEEIRAILDAKDESGQKIHQDVLTPLAAREERHFKNSSCPNCGATACTPTLDLKRPFSQDNPLPNHILRCTACSAEFEPYTRFVRFVPITGGRG